MLRLFQYKHHVYDLHERTFSNEYRFKKVVLRDGIPTYKMDWKTVMIVLELDELGIDIEAQNCLSQIQQESRTSAGYDPSQGMTGEELHNFCKFLYSQIQSKDEEISRLTANIF